MGRWAQRQIRGGGPDVIPPIAVGMASAVIDAGNHHLVVINWTGAVDFAHLDATDFSDPADGATGVSLATINAHSATLTLDVEAADGSELQYVGTTPGLISPDSVIM